VFSAVLVAIALSAVILFGASRGRAIPQNADSVPRVFSQYDISSASPLKNDPDRNRSHDETILIFTVTRSRVRYPGIIFSEKIKRGAYQ